MLLTADMVPHGLSVFTYRSRRGALEAISMLREMPDRCDLSPAEKAAATTTWLRWLRYHRHHHTLMVRMWRDERRAAA